MFHVLPGCFGCVWEVACEAEMGGERCSKPVTVIVIVFLSSVITKPALFEISDPLGACRESAEPEMVSH